MQLVLAAILAALSRIEQEVPAQDVRPARDETADRRALVEVDAPSAAVFVGQRVPLRLRFAVEEGFLEQSMVQPFGAHLDVPVQVTWSGVEIREEAVAERSTFAWNETVRAARRLEDRAVEGRSYRVYSVDADVLAAAPGSLAVPAPVLGYAYATRFEEGLLAGRVALDRVDAFVTGRPVELRVSALPEAGRPADFTGAVGTFSIEADAVPRAIDLGESLRLVLKVRGRGNLGSFEAPRWKDVGGFRVLGVVDEATAEERTFALDLSPYSASVWQIPSIPFAYFDPGDPPGYRIARTEPIAVEVRGPPSGAPAGLPADVPRSSSRGWWIAGAAALLALIVGLLRRR